eukprot:295032-Pyramimonas_sp.AAC.1
MFGGARRILSKCACTRSSLSGSGILFGLCRMSQHSLVLLGIATGAQPRSFSRRRWLGIMDQVSEQFS